MKKRVLSLIPALCLALALTACFGGSSSSSGISSGSSSTSGSSDAASANPVDYASVIEGARTDDFNEAFTIYSGTGDGSYTAYSGTSADMTDDDASAQGQMAWELIGLNSEDVQRFAITTSMMNVHAYGIAIVDPADGKESEVTAALQDFIAGQQAAQKNYLPDQYEIATNAKLETLPGGQVVMVMSEDADKILASIKDALK